LNSTGFNNVAVGDRAGSGVTDANNVICIGAFLPGLNEDNSCFISNIFGAPVGGDAVPVSVDSTGKLGTFASSRRFKREIKPMDKVSEAILSLKPVTFHYRRDKTNTAQFGLIAEEVAEVNPELVIRDKEGKPYTVRYDAVNAMLLNEFLKEHKKVEAQQGKIDQQQATIAELKSTVAQQQKSFQSKLADQERQISALASGLQKVSALMEMNRPNAKVAVNTP
jgi:trimeric autotransporter adhesin